MEPFADCLYTQLNGNFNRSANSAGVKISAGATGVRGRAASFGTVATKPAALRF